MIDECSYAGLAVGIILPVGKLEFFDIFLGDFRSVGCANLVGVARIVLADNIQPAVWSLLGFQVPGRREFHLANERPNNGGRYTSSGIAKLEQRPGTHA